MNLTPPTLLGQTVRLEPISLAHVPALAIAGRDESVWRFLPYGKVTDEAAMTHWVSRLLDQQAQGTDIPFAVILQATGQAIGATRYMDIHAAHRGLEIGGTWYAPEHQRTAANTEAKLLLLRHAFEVMGCIRVQLKTDLRNERSQRAIERLGAVREGVLRDHILMPDGHRRSSVYYSVLDHEWPAVKGLLEKKLTLYSSV
jgi:RimJ/RimL family protein N-acetyltransferase